MYRIAPLVLGILVSACAGHRLPSDSALDRGREIASANCSSCHAIGAAGQSPAPEAPPFRHLSRNYRVDALEEALAEGISVGHPAMPAFQFAPADIAALVRYLQSVQTNERQQPNG